jgi:hypothetical protein
LFLESWRFRNREVGDMLDKLYVTEARKLHLRRPCLYVIQDFEEVRRMSSHPTPRKAGTSRDEIPGRVVNN